MVTTLNSKINQFVKTLNVASVTTNQYGRIAIDLPAAAHIPLLIKTSETNTFYDFSLNMNTKQNIVFSHVRSNIDGAPVINTTINNIVLYYL